jgi:hypothetical protein
MNFKLLLNGAVLFLAVSIGLVARAQTPTDPSLSAAVTALLEQRFQAPPYTNGASILPVVLASTLQPVGAVTFKGGSVVVHSRAEARDLQLAWFIYLSDAQRNGDAVVIKYDTPFNASSGTATLELSQEGWKMTKDEKMRSSSGARMLYGEMYDGVKCRDNSEMARRQLSIGGQSEAPQKAKCASKTFPEVEYYQQTKKLLGK